MFSVLDMNLTRVNVQTTKSSPGGARKENTMIDWTTYYTDYATQRIQRKQELLAEEKAKEQPDPTRIRMLEADIWVLQNS